MRKILAYTFSILTLFFCVSAEEAGSQRMTPEAETSYSGSPSLFARNMINVLNGDYVEKSQDISLNSPVPLTFERFAHNLLPGPFPYVDLCPSSVTLTMRNRSKFSRFGTTTEISQ